MGDSFSGIASTGPLILAVGVAALAGLVSFLSPCILPLVPGYLSYVTGLAGADLDDALNRPTNATRGRIVLGASGFIAGFTTVFVLTSAALAGVGAALHEYQRTLELVVGIVIIVLGLAFLGLVPGASPGTPVPAVARSRPGQRSGAGSGVRAVLDTMYGPNPGGGAESRHDPGHHGPRGHPDHRLLPRPRPTVSHLRARLPQADRPAQARCGATAYGSPGSAAPC